MAKRLLIVLGIIIALALLMWGVIIVLRNSGQQLPIPEKAVENTPISGQLPDDSQSEVPSQPIVPPQPKPQLSEAELEQVRVANFAKDFASRFGTYSNQNFSSNIEELLPSTRDSATTYLESLQGGFDIGSEYVGVTSKALAVRWVQWDSDGVAQVTVSLWRVETRNSEEQEGYQQDIELSLVKQNDRWMVSELRWKESSIDSKL